MISLFQKWNNKLNDIWFKQYFQFKQDARINLSNAFQTHLQLITVYSFAASNFQMMHDEKS